MELTESTKVGRSLCVVFLVSAVIAAGAVGVIAAQDAPGEPHNFYGGAADEADNPAPEGAEIFALIDGDVEDSIVVDEPGQYGGGEAFDDKLAVNDGAGDAVTFRVNSPDGPEALESPFDLTDAEGSVTELDLTFPEGAFQEYSDFEVTIDENASTTEIRPGDNATVEAVVANTGEVAPAAELEFVIDGGNFDDDVVDRQTVEVDEGDSQRVPFAVQLDEEGDYEATVNLVDFGDASTTITVTEDAGPAPGPGLPPAPPDPGEANVQVTEAELSADQIDVGGDVDVTATVENLGGESGVHVVSLTADGEELATEVVSLDAGEATSLTFTETFHEAGEYEIAVDGARAGTLTVGSADVQVTDASLSETDVDVGESVEVTGTVENAGNVVGDATVELLIDGEAVDSRSVSVDGGSSTDVTFDHTFEEEGEYAVALNDASAGTVTVAADDGGDGIPGFGPAVAVVSLLALVAVGRLRAD